jgi:hypothetical protein
MGKSETATASLGIKIRLGDLIEQLNEDNAKLIESMLTDGCIEDENEFYNEVYAGIIDTQERPDVEDVQAFKTYLMTKFTENGSLYKSKRSADPVTKDLSDGCLLEQYLLVPVEEILSTERWGYNRYGTNSSSIDINFSLLVNTEAFKNLKNFSCVFMLTQVSG